MSKNNIWYLAGPFHQYQEDIKALAKEHGLVIVDANAVESRKGEADDVPEVTIRPELLVSAVVVEAGGLSQDHFDLLTAELASIGVIVESFAEQALERPQGELGETAGRLFQVLEAVNAGVASLQRERDGEVEKAGKFQEENGHLRAEIEALRQTASSDPEVEQLKAKLTEAGVTYRANASKESLQKLVDDLDKK
ncbi:hypothetical protein [Pseudomonas sp.]|uniref:hypothetical protein n=1 Tax=Pseudomonas sp. TaxID=306 RepID=UPI0028A612F0|nr:hypothetical protein [Pseudomonas sp.]